jgi:hypothetical protein
MEGGIKQNVLHVQSRGMRTTKLFKLLHCLYEIFSWKMKMNLRRAEKTFFLLALLPSIAFKKLNFLIKLVSEVNKNKREELVSYLSSSSLVVMSTFFASKLN